MKKMLLVAVLSFFSLCAFDQACAHEEMAGPCFEKVYTALS